MGKITVQNIADALSLSRNTVTKALNNGSVAYETKIDIIKKAYEMGYTKLSDDQLSLLEELKSQEVPGTITVIAHFTESPFWNQVLSGIDTELKSKGYRMQLNILEDNLEEAQRFIESVQTDVEGIIFINIFSDQFIEEISRLKLPVTFFDAPVEAETYLKYGDIVLTEGRYAINKLMEPVIALNKKQFLFIGDIHYSREIYDRYQGFRESLWKNNIAFSDSDMCIEKMPKHYYNFEEVENVILNLKNLPEVFVCANDDIAKYVVLTIQNHRLADINEFEITGFDNNIDLDFVREKVRTVNMKKDEVGRRLVKTLLERIESPELGPVMVQIATYQEE